MIAKIKELMYEPSQIRNIGICAHIDHGKTTLSDNLLAGAGMISEELAGDQRFLDFDEQEQARGITIDAANVSMVHDYKDSEYLINLIDTPGHVDFGGDVTRAMRAVDGAVVVVCAVEGIMPQTETVFRQALKENVKPVLFINKVDRLINELKLEPEELQNRFLKIFMEANKLIKNMAPEDKKEEWKLDFTDGSVAFGSAYHNWAINVPTMQETGINFKDIIDYCNAENEKELAQKVPLSDVLLGMVVEHLPSPEEAQKYRVPNIWDGDIDSPAGECMINTSPDGPLAVMVTNVSVDKHAGEIATGRVYGGAIEKGTEVYLVGSHGKSRVQQVGVYFGPERVNTDKVPAGNIVYVAGAKGAIAGETLCSPEHKIKEFEGLEHISEPVVTVAVEAKNTKDLPKLIEVLRQTGKEDPTVKIDINEETGEHLVSGMGELHLEVIGYRISPNKHNRFYITVEPIEPALYEAIQEGNIKEGRVKGKEAANDFMEYGLDKEEARRVWSVHNRSIFLNMTRGIQYLDEVKELLLEGFEETLKKGPLGEEISMGLKFKLHDAKLHEDAVHRGPAQVLPAIRNAILGSMMLAEPSLLEPMQKVVIDTPNDYMGACTREIQNRRGQIVNMGQEGDMARIESKVPVAEMFGFAGDIRSAAEGRCLWSTEIAGFEPLPREMQNQIVREIRQRKGLSAEPFPASHYLGDL